jgi:hypothetical protein
MATILDSSGQPMQPPDSRVVPIRAGDGLANALTGGGTSVDRRVHSRYFVTPLSPAEIEAGYRSRAPLAKGRCATSTSSPATS